MAYDAAVQIPVILFGAFDRHNFGDLLFPHVAAALMPGQRLVFAGLAPRDLSSCGGHEVVPLSRLVLDSTDQPCAQVHVGGEILTCEAWQAAVMLLAPDQAQPTIAYFESRPPQERLAWVRSMLGTSALAPYTVSRRQHAGLARVIYTGVGGTGLDQVGADLRAEVLANLREADAVSVRDLQTRAHLATAGISARLTPDPAVMVAELFGAKIRERARDGEVLQALQAFPRGYIAVQFSADFGDDACLTLIARQLDRIAALEGLGVLLFRAGAAPWHDDLAGLGRVATLLRPGSARLFTSTDLWSICALIAHSRAYCGSSLHGRIVAAAFALPRVNLRPPAATGHSRKQAAYAATWDDTSLPAEVGPGDIADGLCTALAMRPQRLRHQARRLARLYRQGFMAICPGPT
jgi:hypothetical protein